MWLGKPIQHQLTAVPDRTAPAPSGLPQRSLDERFSVVGYLDSAVEMQPAPLDIDSEGKRRDVSDGSSQGRAETLAKSLQAVVPQLLPNFLREIEVKALCPSVH